MPPLAGWHFSCPMNISDHPNAAIIRGLIAKTAIDVLRSYSEINFGTDKVGATIEHNLVVSAIIIGQSDGRLMSASDISNYLGLSRPTVIRRLNELKQYRTVGKKKDGARVCYYLEDSEDPQVLVAVGKVVAGIKRFCCELSKLDTKPVDAGQANS